MYRFRFLKQKREAYDLRKEVDSFCRYLDRIPFKEQLILLEEKEGNWRSVYSCQLYQFVGTGVYRRLDKICSILEKHMKGAVLAVVVCAAEKGKDYYGFWLAGGVWNVFPQEKLLTKKKFFC